MALSVKKSDDGKVVTITISDRFDFQLHRAFNEAYKGIDGKDCAFNIDLQGTTYMDSSALGMLLLLREHTGNQNTNITITNCSHEVAKILKIANFQKFFVIK